jgi:glyoxylase-like metal-dependent hydrolase (beta-lactamase superfamily II)
MLTTIPFILGPVQTNAYLIVDEKTGEAAVIDPAADGHVIVAEAERRNWDITNIWLTHAHFDHIAGINAILEQVTPKPQIALHSEDRPLWQMDGGASIFGVQIDSLPEPTKILAHGDLLRLGSYKFEVRHTPGHTPGHVVFYCQTENIAFCGDVIFKGSIGRTDLPGGDYTTLINSIYTQLMGMPGETRLLTGHGPETTVSWERSSNPFLV